MRLVWCFELRDRHQSAVKFGEESQFKIIELRKADRLGLADRSEAALAAERLPPEEEQENSGRPFVFLALERAIRDEISEIRAAKRKGKIEGKAAVLARQLIKRFGTQNDSTQGRLNTATIEQLELWADRILDATSIEQIFRDA